MFLEELKNEILKKFQKNGIPKPFALALVGSRASGYYTQKSDYDFNAIFIKKIKSGYFNFLKKGQLVSIKIQETKNFEEGIMSEKISSEKSRFAMLPYFPMTNYEYLKLNETLSREIIIKKFIKSFPKGVKIKTNLERLSEWPLIQKSILTPEYTERLRRLLKSIGGFYEFMVPKYNETLKKMGYFISNKNEVIFTNNLEKKSPSNGLLSLNLKRYKIAKELNIRGIGYLKGGLMAGIQSPYHIYNHFNKNPKLKEIKNGLEYIGPSLEEFLNKRKIFIPIENITKKIKNSIMDDLFEN